MVINEESYNKIAVKWAEIRKNAVPLNPVKEFAGKVQPGGTILDVGCGTGFPNTVYLSEQGFRITGIDSAAEMIKIAQSTNIPGASFFETDFFDFRTEIKFDGIIAWDSLWHLPKAKQEMIYPKMCEMLHPGGYFLFSHGKVDNEHVDQMFGEPFYYSALEKEKVIGLLNSNYFSIEFLYENYIENNDQRDFIVLARKNV